MYANLRPAAPDCPSGLDIPYRIRRSARATRLRILVRPDGVEVVAPRWARHRDIERSVEDSRTWIARKLDGMRRALAAHPGAGRLEDGARIWLRGDVVALRVMLARSRGCRVHHDADMRVELPAGLAPERREAAVGDALSRWLKAAAAADAELMVERHGPPHRLLPSAVRIKAQQRLWGSCTARGVVNLNWRLILAPPAIFEYVVVHELCHLRERHHQPPFWRLVGEVLPDYAWRRQWLRANGHLLTLRPGGS